MKIKLYKTAIWRILFLWIIAQTVFGQTTTSDNQQADSLSFYLETAARSNPLVNAGFAQYKAALEKVPQAGAFADPELEIGFFVKPMEQLSGKQITNFTWMQMFPWFGTRKAARNEATEMARMAYEQFRDSRNNLFYEVKSQWYQLAYLREQEKNTEANLFLLTQLEQLALNRYTAPTSKGQPLAASVSPINLPTPSSVSVGIEMAGMGGTATDRTLNQMVDAGTGSSASTVSMGNMPGNSMNNGGMGSSSSGSMSDILRIQLEKAELENTLETIRSTKRGAEARFNALLNRPQEMSVAVPDSLIPCFSPIDREESLDSLIVTNPMLSMLEAEANAYKAKANMDKKMSYPMFGIGLQYSIMAKKEEEMRGMGDGHMNGMDMVMPMVKISIPIFRRKYNAQQRESRQYRNASELKYENTRNQLQAEYETIRLQLDDTYRKIALYRKQYDLSLSTYHLMIHEFSAGAVSLTDVIQVERLMLGYSLKKSEAIATYNTLIAGIEKLLSTSVNE